MSLAEPSIAPPAPRGPGAVASPAAGSASIAPAALPQGEAMLAAVRAIAQGPLAPLAAEIDRGLYPRELLQSLGAAGAYAAHLGPGLQAGDYRSAIRAMASVSAVCGATGFMVWCQQVCGLYLQQSGNPALTGALLADHAAGRRLGGTGMSNPMKAYAAIEPLALMATPVSGGWQVSGSLPWVSNLGPDHYLGTAAALDDGSGQELMFLLRCDAPGVRLRDCASFSGMEGTGTYSVRCERVFIGADDAIAMPAKPWVGRIRSAFILLQCGFGLGVVQGAVAAMQRVEARLGHVNAYLDDRPDTVQAELDALWARSDALCTDPFTPGDAYFADVLRLRADVSLLALRAAQSSLMHAGARGYLMSSDVQRRVRESHFVAIVSPAVKHVRKELARLGAA